MLDHVGALYQHDFTLRNYIHCDNFMDILKNAKFGAWPQVLLEISNLMRNNKELNYNSSNIMS